VSSVAVGGVDGTSLVMALDLEGIAASGGSACSSGSNAGSHVIKALYGASDPYATVRFSLGRRSTRDDIERASDATIAVVTRLRKGAVA
jgi:cysteine desulfurase